MTIFATGPPLTLDMLDKNAALIAQASSRQGEFHIAALFHALLTLRHSLLPRSLMPPPARRLAPSQDFNDAAGQALHNYRNNMATPQRRLMRRRLFQ